MYQQDWLDDLQWAAIAIGTALAVALQVIVTFLVLRPFELTSDWSAVALVELCIAIGAFVAGWRARRGALVNGLITALVSAIISLAATLLRTPGALSLASVVFLFGTFATMGVIGGLLAWRVQVWRRAR